MDSINRNAWLDVVSTPGSVMISRSNELDCSTGPTEPQSVLGPDGATSRPDALLVAAVRSDPPDEAALDALVERYWPQLFARCQLMTQDRQQAADLAQEAWYRVLRARPNLKPEGNFRAYLMTVATNLWRDSNRSERRAGAMAERRLLSLDATSSNDDGEMTSLAELLPDSRSLEANQSKLLEMDIDQALARLTPLLRDVLLSRFVIGESCAEIAARYSRTEQTVSGWVREAIRRVNQFLR
jgi:RNA polymerase sigma-70 factor (ECF subfamily)